MSWLTAAKVCLEKSKEIGTRSFCSLFPLIATHFDLPWAVTGTRIGTNPSSV